MPPAADPFRCRDPQIASFTLSPNYKPRGPKAVKGAWSRHHVSSGYISALGSAAPGRRYDAVDFSLIEGLGEYVETAEVQDLGPQRLVGSTGGHNQIGSAFEKVPPGSIGQRTLANHN